MLALIPLRGGSKGIPGKNIKELCGKPLCHWVLEQALEADIFDRVVVSTDSEEIKEVVHSLSKEIVVHMRPSELATGDSPTEETMLHIAELEDFDIMCLIQATSPLTEAYDLVAARCKFMSWGVDSMVTVQQFNKFAWLPDQHDFIVRPVNYKPRFRPMRQDITPVYIETGNFYFTRRWVLDALKCRLGGRVGRYIIDSNRAIDIDTTDDFAEAEKMLRRREDEKKNQSGTCR